MDSKKRLLIGTATVALLAVILGGAAHAVPVIDGRFDPAEGYTNEFSVVLNVEGLKKNDPLILAPDPGTLRTYVDPGTGEVSVLFSQPLTLVDNTYGANAIGWGLDAPSGKGHKFEDLVGSDKAQFTFTDGLGNVVLDVVVDYINQAQQGGAYRSGGVLGKDGDVITGAASGVLEWGTSLDYNFNTLGHSGFLVDSPLSVPDYTDPASAPGWVFEVMYELKIGGDVFGDSGFGAVAVPIVHDSPNKIGKNKVYPDPPKNRLRRPSPKLARSRCSPQASSA